MYNLHPLAFLLVADNLGLATEFNSMTKNHVHDLAETQATAVHRHHLLLLAQNGYAMANRALHVFFGTLRQKEIYFDANKLRWLPRVITNMVLIEREVENET